MRSAIFAEWIIARLTTRTGAASIIGDLLESVPQKGMVWFWVSVARVVLSLTWRRPLAFIGALCFGMVSARTLGFSVVGMYHFHSAPLSFFGLFSDLGRLGVLLSFGVAYTAIRFGLKDTFVRHIFAAWLLLAVIMFYGTIPFVAYACAVVAICGFLYSAVSAQRRIGLFALATLVAISFSLRMLNVFLLSVWLHGDRIVFRGWSPVAISLMLVGLLIQNFIFSRVHRGFFERNPRPSDSISPGDAQTSTANS
ncbi:MAG: hypothetical protein WAM91_09105 [Candidatus Acidiferrales bacterium]